MSQLLEICFTSPSHIWRWNIPNSWVWNIGTFPNPWLRLLPNNKKVPEICSEQFERLLICALLKNSKVAILRRIPFCVHIDFGFVSGVWTCDLGISPTKQNHRFFLPVCTVETCIQMHLHRWAEQKAVPWAKASRIVSPGRDSDSAESAAGGRAHFVVLVAPWQGKRRHA